MKAPAALCPVALLAVAGRVAAQPAMSYLRTHGPSADPVTRLNWGLMAISVLVSVIIGVLVLVATFRKRPPLAPDAAGRLPVGRDSGGMWWIYIGISITTVVLFGSTVWTMTTLSAVASPSRKPALTIEVTAHQWWWEVRYLSDDPSRVVTTANEIHIPEGVPVEVQLGSVDVIHSFWVPQLAGKTDLIPGQTNTMWIQADQPGDYRGQCGEYCGAQHAHMAFHVIADRPADFQAWWRRQLASANVAQAGAARHGEAVFAVRCSACHTVRGTDAQGRLGPDLTHLMGRRMIAAGSMPNNPGMLMAWIASPQSFKPGTRMPQVGLSGEDLADVVSYLGTLQ